MTVLSVAPGERHIVKGTKVKLPPQQQGQVQLTTLSSETVLISITHSEERFSSWFTQKDAPAIVTTSLGFTRDSSLPAEALSPLRLSALRVTLAAGVLPEAKKRSCSWSKSDSESVGLGRRNIPKPVKKKRFVYHTTAETQMFCTRYVKL